MPINLKTDHSRLIVAFFFALLPGLIFPAVLPWMRLTFFAPFLIIAYYKKGFTTCLWFSFLIGLGMDLYSSHKHLGLYALNYCLTTWILRPQKRHFFEDKVSTIPLMTLLFAITSTLIQMVLLDLFETGLLVTKEWVFTDLILFPIADALYAFIWFTLPGIFLPRSPQREYFRQ